MLDEIKRRYSDRQVAIEAKKVSATFLEETMHADMGALLAEIASLQAKVASLSERVDLLDLFEELGVDNWPGHGQALQILRDEAAGIEPSDG